MVKRRVINNVFTSHCIQHVRCEFLQCLLVPRVSNDYSCIQIYAGVLNLLVEADVLGPVGLSRSLVL